MLGRGHAGTIRSTARVCGDGRRCSPARRSCAAGTVDGRRPAVVEAACHHAVDDGRSEVSQAAAIAVAQPARIVIA